MLDSLLLAHRVRAPMWPPCVIADRHSTPTDAAEDQLLQMRWPFSRWTLPAVGSLGLCRFAQPSLIGFIFFPGKVAGVCAGDQRVPLIPRQPH